MSQLRAPPSWCCNSTGWMESKYYYYYYITSYATFG